MIIHSPQNGSISHLEDDNDFESARIGPTPSRSTSPPPAQSARMTRSRSIIETAPSSSPTRDRTRGNSVVDARTQTPRSPSSKHSGSEAMYVSAAEDSDQEVILVDASDETKEDLLRGATAPTSEPVASSQQAGASAVRLSSSPMELLASRHANVEGAISVDEVVSSGIRIQELAQGPSTVELRKSSPSWPIPVQPKEEVPDEDASMDMEPESDDIVEANGTVDPAMIESTPSQAPAPEVPKYIPIHIPLPPSIHEDILIPTPTQAHNEDEFQMGSSADLRFEAVAQEEEDEVANDKTRFHPNYTLPPLSVLPADFIRKSKSAKKSKKEKDGKKEREKDESAPMGIYKWGATLQVNPVHKRVAKATKCLSTREWGVCNTDYEVRIQ